MPLKRNRNCKIENQNSKKRGRSIYFVLVPIPLQSWIVNRKEKHGNPRNESLKMCTMSDYAEMWFIASYGIEAQSVFSAGCCGLRVCGGCAGYPSESVTKGSRREPYLVVAETACWADKKIDILAKGLGVWLWLSYVELLVAWRRVNKSRGRTLGKKQRGVSNSTPR